MNMHANNLVWEEFLSKYMQYMESISETIYRLIAIVILKVGTESTEMRSQT